MKIYEKIRKIDENRRKSTKIEENRRKSTEIYEKNTKIETKGTTMQHFHPRLQISRSQPLKKFKKFEKIKNKNSCPGF